jgi:polyhydroxyalkanoate synthesis regulator phasin
MEATAIKNEEITSINKKIDELEDQMIEFSNEMDVSNLKESLFEIILTTAGLRDIEKMSFYLKEILSIIHDMKEKGIWNDEDKDFVTTMMKEISENWKSYGEENMSKLFDEIKDKVETA